MKQGNASRDGAYGRKREPIAKAVSPAAVSQIGSAMGNKATNKAGILDGAVKELYSGRGYEAPMNKSQSHQGGSQRRYR